MSEKEMVLSFDGGHVEGMYFDDFTLDFLEGAIHIARATDIRFNETTQDWEIVLTGQDAPVSDAVKGFKKYEEARKFEVLWLQTCRKREIDPDTKYGEAVAADARAAAEVKAIDMTLLDALWAAYRDASEKEDVAAYGAATEAEAATKAAADAYRAYVAAADAAEARGKDD